MEEILLEEKTDPQITKLSVFGVKEIMPFLTQQDISINMIKEIEFHQKCLRDDVIDCEDFVTSY